MALLSHQVSTLTLTPTPPPPPPGPVDYFCLFPPFALITLGQLTLVNQLNVRDCNGLADRGGPIAFFKHPFSQPTLFDAQSTADQAAHIGTR